MADERSTIVGESIVIKGEISGDQDLILHGKVEGEIRLTKDIFIKPPSETHANIKARNVTLSGRVEGNVDAEQRVELLADGAMIGDIRSPRIVIVDGAYFKGTIDMGDEANRPKSTSNNEVTAEQEKEERSSKDSKVPRSNATTQGAQEEHGGQEDNKDRRMVMPDYLLGKKK